MSGSKYNYKPRLKKGIFNNRKNVETTKKQLFLKKLTWQSFMLGKEFVYMRNDILISNNQLFDQRKRYKFGNLSKQIFFSYFSTLKNKNLMGGLLKKKNRLNQKIRAGYFFNSLGYRLDFLLLKAGFSKTIFQSRWLISRRLVLVNNKKNVSPSYNVNIGDFVQLALFQKSLKEEVFFSQFSTSFSHFSLEICMETFSFVVLEFPSISRHNIGVFPLFFNFEELTNFC